MSASSSPAALLYFSHKTQTHSQRVPTAVFPTIVCCFLHLQAPKKKCPTGHAAVVCTFKTEFIVCATAAASQHRYLHHTHKHTDAKRNRVYHTCGFICFALAVWHAFDIVFVSDRCCVWRAICAFEATRKWVMRQYLQFVMYYVIQHPKCVRGICICVSMTDFLCVAISVNGVYGLFRFTTRFGFGFENRPVCYENSQAS